MDRRWDGCTRRILQVSVIRKPCGKSHLTLLRLDCGHRTKNLHGFAPKHIFVGGDAICGTCMALKKEVADVAGSL